MKGSVADLAILAMRKIADQERGSAITEGIVLSVNKVDKTCDVQRDNLPMLNAVRLNAVLNANNPLTIFPLVGSYVLCAQVEDDPADTYVIAITAVEEVSGQIGNTSLTWNAQGISINGGLLGGITNTLELGFQLQKLSSRVDGIISSILGGIPGSGDGGAALQASIIAGLSAINDREDFSEIEDKLIKH